MRESAGTAYIFSFVISADINETIILHSNIFTLRRGLMLREWLDLLSRSFHVFVHSSFTSSVAVRVRHVQVPQAIFRLFPFHR